MSAPPPDDARRLRGVLSRLLSDHDGERLAAVNALLALLGRNGIPIVDLVPREGSADPTIAACWGPKAARRAMYPERGGPPAAVPLTRQHQRVARGLLWSATLWSSREQDFLSKMAGQWDIPTDRQLNWMESLRAKAERQRACRESADV